MREILAEPGWLAVGLAGQELMSRIANAMTNYARELNQEKYKKKIMIYQHALNEYAIKTKEFHQESVQKNLGIFRSRHLDQKYTTGVMVFFR